MRTILALLLVAATASARPTVAVVAQNDGTEITDFLVPYGVIASAGTVDVVAVATADGPVAMWPGLTIEADTTIDAFDRTHPDGADVVVVPAMHDAGNEVTRRWLRTQAARGATIVSICDGALVVAGTGLLDGRRATGHFYSATQRQRDFPAVHWVNDTRWVHDGPFVSTSGVSASLPAAVYVTGLVAGATRAQEVARAQGLAVVDATHDSNAFRIGTAEYWLGARNLLFGWPRDVYAVELRDGMDEVALAFTVDMLSRTYFSHAIAVAPTATITTRHGLRVRRDVAPDAVPVRAIAVGTDGIVVRDGARAPDDVLAVLTTRYGPDVAGFVATQLEYPTSR
ncbi:MAG TPA: DJ-1/PfpI family protein [Candidatus Binatia bacterium]|jgi:putative intracellular protease/amidase|nr:DJ-1/PfpI family protein [Candidatus Binatia bacterium]